MSIDNTDAQKCIEDAAVPFLRRVWYCGIGIVLLWLAMRNSCPYTPHGHEPPRTTSGTIISTALYVPISILSSVYGPLQYVP